MCEVVVVPTEDTTMALWKEQWRVISGDSASHFMTRVYGLNTVPGLPRVEDGALSGIYLTRNCQEAIELAETLCLEPWAELFVRLRTVGTLVLKPGHKASEHGVLSTTFGRRRVFYVLYVETDSAGQILQAIQTVIPDAREAKQTHGEWGGALFGQDDYRTTLFIPSISRSPQDCLNKLAAIRELFGVTYALIFIEER